MPYLVDPLAHAGMTNPKRRPSPELGEHTEEIKRELREARKTRAPAESAG